jgi:chromosome segregation ATPase
MATKNETDDTDKKIARLEARVSDLEQQLRDEKARRAQAEAKYEGYSAAVKDLGRRDGDGGERGGYGMFPFHPMMFRRPY